jgi:hypothetical protein
MVFIPEGNQLVWGLSDIAAIIDLACKRAGSIERCNDPLIHAHLDAEIALQIATPVWTGCPSFNRSISVSTSLSCTFLTTPAESVVRHVINSMKRRGSAAFLSPILGQYAANA